MGSTINDPGRNEPVDELAGTDVDLVDPLRLGRVMASLPDRGALERLSRYERGLQRDLVSTLKVCHCPKALSGVLCGYISCQTGTGASVWPCFRGWVGHPGMLQNGTIGFVLQDCDPAACSLVLASYDNSYRIRQQHHDATLDKKTVSNPHLTM